MEVLVVLLVLLVGSRLSECHQPNVLLIVVDDLRPILGCYGDSLAITPNINALAQDGMIFTRAYAQQALCGPSRTSFLTSRRPDTTRLYDVHSYWRTHAGNFTSLPQYFKENGYHTASAGKIFHPGIVSNHSDDQPYSWSETPFHPPTQAHKQDPVCLGPDGSLHTSIYCPVQVEEQPGGSLPDIETTRYSISWLEQWANRTHTQTQVPTQSFFLAVGYHKPHIPLKFPKEFLDLYPISSVPLAPNRWLPKGLPPVAWNPWNDLRWRADIAALNVSFPYGPMPDFYARYIRQGYYAATSYTDSLIGQLLATVDRLFPDTIIAFIGDHGWSLGEHQEWSKFSNFEVSTRVPFIIRNWRRNHNHSPLDQHSLPLDHHSLPLDDHSLPFDNHSLPLNSHSLPHSDTFHHSSDTPDFTVTSSRQSAKHTETTNPTKYPGTTHSSSSVDCDSLGITKTSSTGRGMVYNGLVELVDLFPTLVDLAGLPALDSCPKNSREVKVCTEGMSLSHLMHCERRKHDYNNNYDYNNIYNSNNENRKIDSHDTNNKYKNNKSDNNIHIYNSDNNNYNNNENRKINYDDAYNNNNYKSVNSIHIYNSDNNNYNYIHNSNDDNGKISDRDATRNEVLITRTQPTRSNKLWSEEGKNTTSSSNKYRDDSIDKSTFKRFEAKELKWKLTQGRIGLLKDVKETKKLKLRRQDMTRFLRDVKETKKQEKNRVLRGVKETKKVELKRQRRSVGAFRDINKTKKLELKLKQKQGLLRDVKEIKKLELKRQKSIRVFRDINKTKKQEFKLKKMISLLSDRRKTDILESKQQQERSGLLRDVKNAPKPLQRPEKKAAFSQYPRPGPEPSRDPDSDQPHTRDTTIMGYSVRSDRFRYTAWLAFDNKTYQPDWDHIIAEELYDHKIDPSEDHNVVGKRYYIKHRREMYTMLVKGWRRAVRYS